MHSTVSSTTPKVQLPWPSTHGNSEVHGSLIFPQYGPQVRLPSTANRMAVRDMAVRDMAVCDMAVFDMVECKMAVCDIAVCDMAMRDMSCVTFTCTSVAVTSKPNLLCCILRKLSDFAFCCCVI